MHEDCQMLILYIRLHTCTTYQAFATDLFPHASFSAHLILKGESRFDIR